MIKQYFETLMNTLLDEKINLEKRNTETENRIKEIDRFIEILEEKNDTSFESFTPREVNSKNKEKIKELEQEKKNLQKDLIDVKQKTTENEKSIEELNSMITYMRNQELEQREREELAEKQENVSREKNSEIEEKFSEIDGILKKTNSSLQFLDIDPMRAKVELRQFFFRLEEQIEKLRELF